MVSSSPEKSPDEMDHDIDLPDAPVLNQEAPEQDEAASTSAPRPRNTVHLDALFDTDEEEGDFSSSDAAISSSPPLPSALAQSTATAHSESYSDPSLMLQFYYRLFTFRTLF